MADTLVNHRKKLTTETFTHIAVDIHGNKYDYSKSIYVNRRSEVTIICPLHGEFKQLASKHIINNSTPRCSGCAQQKRLDIFIKNSRKVHGKRYDYSKSEYVGNKIPVIIICSIHGEFKQRPNDHTSGGGCSACSGVKKLTTNDFVSKSIKIHNERYGYEKSKYVNRRAKLIITCPIHGDFKQRPSDHLSGKGCGACSGRLRLSTEEFILQSKKIHGDRYDYRQSIYTNANNRVTIICSAHGSFEQLPYIHRNGVGCPKCNREESYQAKKEESIKHFVKELISKHGNKYIYDNSRQSKPSGKKNIVTCLKHGDFETLPYGSFKGCSLCAKEKKRNNNFISFLKKASRVHENKYIYHQSSYISLSDNVSVTCIKHEEVFVHSAAMHLLGISKCVGCEKEKKDRESKEKYKDFVFRARERHGNKYIYDEKSFTCLTSKINATCKIHGEFEIIPSAHIHKTKASGCIKCFHESRRRKIDDFVLKANIVHNGKYSYDGVVYNRSSDYITIRCPKHGDFKKIANEHLRGTGCIKCKRDATIINFLEMARKVHKNKYSYILISLVNLATKIQVVCPEHGIFKASTQGHLKGKKCPKCKVNERLLNFINRGNKIHNKYYDYSQSIYISSENKLNVICPKHGSFMITPHSHLKGSGCKLCTESKGEKTIRYFLEQNNVVFLQEHSWNYLLRDKGVLRVDFYLPELNKVIEFDGRQHFEPVNFGGMDDDKAMTAFKECKARDKIKNSFCRKKKIEMIRISYKDINNIKSILKLKLFEEST